MIDGGLESLVFVSQTISYQNIIDWAQFLLQTGGTRRLFVVSFCGHITPYARKQVVEVLHCNILCVQCSSAYTSSSYYTNRSSDLKSSDAIMAQRAHVPMKAGVSV
jgi:hypothetical protein